MSIASPRTGITEPMDLSEVISGMDISGASFGPSSDGCSGFYDMTFDGCIFSGVDMRSVTFRNVSLTDCVFTGCDISNRVFSGVSLRRVSFERCLLTGLDLSQSGIYDLSVSDSKAMYLNFTRSKVRNMSFTDTDMSGSFFLDTDLKGALFRACRLSECEFSGVSLKGTDLSECDISGIRADMFSVRGMIIDPLQAQDLAGLLGVVLKERGIRN